MSDKSLMTDADSILLLQRFIKICEQENNPAIALLLNQLINTIAEIGVDNVKPHRPVEAEVAKSIESDRIYFISTVHMNGHGVKEDWFETAVFLSDENGEVKCWMPVYSDGYSSLEEAKAERARVRIKVQSGIFDKINPWEI